MSPRHQPMRRALTVWNAVENAIIGLLLISALSMALYDMAARIFNPIWVTGFSEELVVYFVVWALFIAASALTWERRHVRADLIVQMLPLTGRRLAEIIHCLIGIAFGATLFHFSYQGAYEAWKYGDLSVGTLRMPLWIFYAGLPVGFGLVVMRYLLRLFALCFQFTPRLLERAENED